jgi:hypothetical protein
MAVAHAIRYVQDGPKADIQLQFGGTVRHLSGSDALTCPNEVRVEFTVLWKSKGNRISWKTYAVVYLLHTRREKAK